MQYYFYILTDQYNAVFDIGVTGDLKNKVRNKNKVPQNSTEGKELNKLVYYEIYYNPYNAMAREAHVEDFTDEEKTDLVNVRNPEWLDLSNVP